MGICIIKGEPKMKAIYEIVGEENCEFNPFKDVKDLAFFHGDSNGRFSCGWITKVGGMEQHGHIILTPFLRIEIELQTQAQAIMFLKKLVKRYQLEVKLNLPDKEEPIIGRLDVKVE